MVPWRDTGTSQCLDAVVLTKHNEASVCVCGAQWVLGCAAEHGAIELRGNSLQNKFPSNELLAAVQQASAHSGPGEHGLGEHISLWTHKHASVGRPFLELYLETWWNLQWKVPVGSPGRSCAPCPRPWHGWGSWITWVLLEQLIKKPMRCCWAWLNTFLNVFTRCKPHFDQVITQGHVFQIFRLAVETGVIPNINHRSKVGVQPSKAKLSIYRSIYIPTLTYRHESLEMSFLHRLAGLLDPEGQGEFMVVASA